jgi:protein gp37
MIDQTKIEWCDFTVNFWEGCQKVGPGCDHCYAETRDKRFTGGKHWGPGAPRRKVKGGIDKLRKIHRNGKDFMAEHGHWPRVFCSSLSDVFDNAVSPDWRREAFDAMSAATDTRLLLLTKRIGNVFKMVPPAWLQGGWPRHVGLMITVVSQEEANRDIPKLLDLKARFGIPWVGLSMEPLLGAVRVRGLYPVEDDGIGIPAIDWVICGGESGAGARPMHPDWVRDLRDQCKAAGTPFLFKQWGEWQPRERCIPRVAGEVIVWPNGKTGGGIGGANKNGGGGWSSVRTGKKAAGRQLDGETWTQFPEALT